MGEGNRWSKENDFLFGFGGRLRFLLTYRFILLILCLGWDKNSLTSWDLFPRIVRICLWGRSFAKRCVSLLQIIESWLSNAGQFKCHRLLQIPSVLLYASDDQLASPMCAWWRASKAMQGRRVRRESVLREHDQPRSGQRGPPCVSKVASSHKATQSLLQRHLVESVCSSVCSSAKWCIARSPLYCPKDKMR